MLISSACGEAVRAVGFGFTPLSDPADDIGHLAIGRIEQIGLADERVLDLARELEPVRRRPRAQIAERANCPLTRPFRGVDRFHQHVIGVGRTFVGANRFANVHATTNHKKADVQVKIT